MTYIVPQNGAKVKGGGSEYSVSSTKLNILTIRDRLPTDIGMARLTLSDSDKLVRDWFIETTKSYGCEVTIDEMGNIFAVRSGKKDGLPTVMGSHLDTQPAGGRYDGILGVLAGIAALRAIHESGVETEYPVGVVDWTK